MVPSGASSSQSSPAYYTICCCSSFRFLIEAENLLDGFVYLATLAVEKFVLILGPLLICFASAIIVGLSWTFFTVVLPMMQHRYQDSPYRYWILGIHVGFVSFLLVQIVFNYFMCVMTPNKGPNYEAVVRELAVATRFDYPESPQAVEQFRREHEDKMIIRMKRRQLREMEDEKQNAKSSTMASNTSGASTSSTTPTSATSTTTTTGTLSLDVPPAESATKITKRNKKQTKQTMTNSIRASQPTPKQIRNWMLMAPDEWGYCQRSRQAKPPRSHYDHVTKTLVLCLDHYCPWMFNAGESLCVYLFVLFGSVMYAGLLKFHFSLFVFQSVISITATSAISYCSLIRACSMELPLPTGHFVIYPVHSTDPSSKNFERRVPGLDCIQWFPLRKIVSQSLWVLCCVWQSE